MCRPLKRSKRAKSRAEKEAGIKDKKAADNVLMTENLQMGATIAKLRGVVAQQKNEIVRLREFVERHDPAFCQVTRNATPRCGSPVDRCWCVPADH